MVQGRNLKPAKSTAQKTSKKHRQQVERGRHKEGLKKSAKKPRGADEHVRQKMKLNKKLTGTVTSHIEQLMMARVQEDRGPTAPSQLKVLRKDDGYLKTLKANKGRHSKGQKNKRKQVKQAGGVQPPTSGQ